MRNTSSFYWDWDSCHLFLWKQPKQEALSVWETYIRKTNINKWLCTHARSLPLSPKTATTIQHNLETRKKSIPTNYKKWKVFGKKLLSESKTNIFCSRKKTKQQFQWFATVSISRSYYILHGFTGHACLLQPQAENPLPLPPPTLSSALPPLW